MKIKFEIEFDIEAPDSEQDAVIALLEDQVCKCLPGVVECGDGSGYFVAGFELVTLRDVPGDAK